eukprot:COSAG02_NODE_715_length_18086_cov_109.753433_21_plen_78_part_00
MGGVSVMVCDVWINACGQATITACVFPLVAACAADRGGTCSPARESPLAYVAVLPLSTHVLCCELGGVPHLARVGRR